MDLRVPKLDGSGKVSESVLPDRLNETTLSATIADAVAAVPVPLPVGGELAAMGDSITDNGNTTWLLGDRRTAGGIIYAAVSWLAHMFLNIGGRYRFGGVFATPGLTPSQIRDAHLAEVIARKPQVCVVFAGANGVEYESTKPGLVDIWSGLAAAGITPILCTILPQYKDGALHLPDLIADLNTFIIKYAADHGHLCVDLYAATVNPATGQMKVGYTTDGVHPTAAGAEAIGKAIATAVTAATRPQLVPLAQANITQQSLVPNPLMLSDTSSTGDGQPDNWNPMAGFGTSVRELVDVPGVAGKMFRLTRGDTDAIFTSDSFAMTPGHRYLFAFQFKGEATAGQGFNIGLERAGGGFLVRFDDFLGSTTRGPIFWEFVYPGDLAAASYNFKYWARGAGTIAELGQVTLRDLGLA